MPTNRKTIKTLGSERVIILSGEITESSAAEIVRQLFLLDKKSNKDILLIINSDGGNIEDGIFLANVFKLLKSDVAILVPSNAQSTGTFLLASGTKGKRIVMPGAVAMMHGSIYSMSELPHKVQKSDVDFQEGRENYIAQRLADCGYKHKEHSLTSEYHHYVGIEIINVGLADIMINSLEELHKIINI